MRRVPRNRSALFGLVILGTIVTLALLAPWIARFDPIKQNPRESSRPPSGRDHGDVSVVHDEQSVLTPARVAAIAEELTVSLPGRRLTGFVRVDSRQDARVQLADLVAGVVRRGVEDRLSGSASGPAVPVGHLVADGSAVAELGARRA